MTQSTPGEQQNQYPVGTPAQRDQQSPRLSVPVAKKLATQRSFHGRDFHDDYEWLRDKESQEVLDHLAAEDAFAVQETEHLKPLREAIYQEVKSRVQETEIGRAHV